MDDTTLGKLFTEAHRGQADYRRLEGVSVSPSSMSVMVDRTGKSVGKSNIDHFSFGVRNTYSAHSKFSENTQAEKVVDGRWNLMSEISRMHRLGLYLTNRVRWLSKSIARKWVVTKSKQLIQKKSADFYKKKYGVRNWNYVKHVNNVLQKWRLVDYQNTILDLSGKVQELQNEVNCMNDSKDFQDAESVRSGSRHPVGSSP